MSQQLTLESFINFHLDIKADDNMFSIFDGIKKSLVRKAIFFYRNNLIVESDGKWLIKPNKTFNKTTRVVESIGAVFYCDCQGFRKNNICSHILAIKLYERMKKRC